MPTCPEPVAHVNVKVGQLSGAGFVPWLFTLMVTVDPELVSVAVPVTVQFPDMPPKVPVAVTVAAVSVELPLLVVVKVILPGIVVGEEVPQVSVKL